MYYYCTIAWTFGNDDPLLKPLLQNLATEFYSDLCLGTGQTLLSSCGTASDGL